MIGKAKSISHGINALRYITGELEEQETSRTDIPHQGQPASVQTRCAGRMGYDKSPCADGQEHDPH